MEKMASVIFRIPGSPKMKTRLLAKQRWMLSQILQVQYIFKLETAYLWIDTTLYALFKWNITVSMPGYSQIHNIMSRNATICP